MVIEQELEVMERPNSDVLAGLYRSSERSKHPHPKKIRAECSLDEDVVQWLKAKTKEGEEYPMYINYYLKKVMAGER